VRRRARVGWWLALLGGAVGGLGDLDARAADLARGGGAGLALDAVEPVGDARALRGEAPVAALPMVASDLGVAAVVGHGLGERLGRGHVVGLPRQAALVARRALRADDPLAAAADLGGPALRQQAAGAAPELDDHGRDIRHPLRLAGVGAAHVHLARAGEDAADPAVEPQPLVEDVDGLLDQHPAALLLDEQPRMPGREPAELGAVDELRLAQGAVVEEPLELLLRGAEAHDVGDVELDAGLPRGGDHPVGLADGAAHGLLEQDVLAGPGGGDGDLAVGLWVGRDDHGVHVVPREQGLPVVADLGAEALGLLLGVLPLQIGHGRDAAAPSPPLEIGHVRAPEDPAAADHADANRCHGPAPEGGGLQWQSS